MTKRDVYLDGAANTPVDKRVLKAMKPYLSDKFMGNASSTHDYGMRASMAVEQSRSTLGLCLGIPPEAIIFTSGATEGNNTAVKSLALGQLINKTSGQECKKHIICGATEHSSVYNSCKQMELLGFNVTYVQPTEYGRIKVETVLSALQPDTFLICLMAINNELGVNNDIYMTTLRAREFGIFTLIDCTQDISYGGLHSKLGSIYPNADMMTFSSHKIYGPTGVGCLIVNNPDCLDQLKKFPLISGGSQEGGMRGGTYNVAGIVGMTKAVELICGTNNGVPYSRHYTVLCDYFLKLVRENQLPVKLNVPCVRKNILSLDLSEFNICVTAASDLAMNGIACSAGSACDAEHDETQGDFNPSHVLTAIKLPVEVIKNTVRISFTKYTSLSDIEQLVKVLKTMVK